MKYLLIIITFIILSCIYDVKTFADVSYADLFMNERGYKPVEDTLSVKSLSARLPDGSIASDNLPYKEWCINTFKNGEQIYDAYKEIAFDVNYRAEPPKTDYWQTPLETRQKKQGDCEDSVFLFFSQLSGTDVDGEIIWGWVVDKRSSIAFAHVWYQLFDKHGRPYIVEGFSKEWNGIIPVEIITEAEERVPTLMLRHNQVNHMVNEMIPGFTESFEDKQFSWNVYMSNNGIIKEIFLKLHDMFTRYREQVHQLSG